MCSLPHTLIIIISIHIALAVYSRSTSAYEALKSFDLLQLPSSDTLKDFKSPLTCAPGEIDSRLQKERELYDGRIKEAMERKKINSGYLLPLSLGVLIFDEVKVGMKVQWNSSNDAIVGYSMTREDMSSLRDVYELLDDDFR